MRLPAEVEIRQDEMRRAADVARERDPLPKRSGWVPPPRSELTLADDCALMLEAWFATYERPGHAALIRRKDVGALAAQMRELGRNSQDRRKL